MLEIRFIASIAERDIDLVLMEELSVSDEFRGWFSSRVDGVPAYHSNVGVWHSVNDGVLGESDVIFIFMSLLGQRVALLIENKIDAPPQPQQGERYKLRGESGVKAGYWDTFKTCVIAPIRYFSSNHSQTYDVEIAYEELLEFFSSRGSVDARYMYKAKIVQEAIDQNRRGYQPEYSDAMTHFVKQYHAAALESFPELGVQDAKPRPSGSTWIMFSPAGLPKQMSLCHQLTAGMVKLFFSGSMYDISSVQTKYSPLIGSEMTIRQAGRSVAISVQVPKVAPLTSSFQEERGKVVEALGAVATLLSAVRNAEGGQPIR